MGSLFDDGIFPGAWDLLAATHGEDALITPGGGSPAAATVRCMFHRGVTLREASRTGALGQAAEGRQRAFGVLVVPPGAFPGWTPSTSDTVAIAGVSYQVAELGPTEPGVRLQLAETNL